jgi:hypothetical protein
MTLSSNKNFRATATYSSIINWLRKQLNEHFYVDNNGSLNITEACLKLGEYLEKDDPLKPSTIKTIFNSNRTLTFESFELILKAINKKLLSENPRHSLINIESVSKELGINDVSSHLIPRPKPLVKQPAVNKNEPKYFNEANKKLAQFIRNNIDEFFNEDHTGEKNLKELESNLGYKAKVIVRIGTTLPFTFNKINDFALAKYKNRKDLIGNVVNLLTDAEVATREEILKNANSEDKLKSFVNLLFKKKEIAKDKKGDGFVIHNERNQNPEKNIPQGTPEKNIEAIFEPKNVTKFSKKFKKIYKTITTLLDDEYFYNFQNGDKNKNHLFKIIDQKEYRIVAQIVQLENGVRDESGKIFTHGVNLFAVNNGNIIPIHNKKFGGGRDAEDDLASYTADLTCEIYKNQNLSLVDAIDILNKNIERKNQQSASVEI